MHAEAVNSELDETVESEKKMKIVVKTEISLDTLVYP